MDFSEIMEFYKGKRVFVTGHTGFKGAWLVKILTMAGAEITGYAFEPPTKPSMWELLGSDSKINSVTGDVRDFDALKTAFDDARPEIVFHLAAQSIVRGGYDNPRETYETNAMGTVNILECVRSWDCVKSFLNVTTDKVYENNGADAFSENSRLDGFDPYSNSKSCSELITRSYRDSFFAEKNVAVSTARAGNAIGGGDFAPHRIIPDCVRALEESRDIIVRNPHSIRPYQHVLEPITAYMMIARAQYDDKRVEGSYNIGPDKSDYVRTQELAELFCGAWGHVLWKSEPKKNEFQEAEQLRIDCSKIKDALDWSPKWKVKTAVEKTVEWTKAYMKGEDINAVTEKQINEYIKGGH